jgi:membrane fusion protein (multidrug efflux system)
MMPVRYLPGLLIGAFILSACQQGAESDVAEEEDDTPAIPVETATATRSDIYAMYSGTAPIEAFADALVIAKVGGEVREIFVEEGDDVTAGQILARLDGDRLRLETRQAEARLQKLRRDYERNVDLSERGLISAGDFEKIKFDMDSLEAAYNLARLELSYTEIRAPIDGVISERFIKIGNVLDANPPSSTFQITSLEPLVSYLHVPEREYRRISAGQAAVIEVDALANDEFAATVARISPVVDPATGTFKITVEVSDPTRRLKPGMFGRINIVHDVHENALQVPRSAIVDEAGETAVFVVEGETAHRRVVETGYSEDGYVEITSGLSDDDRFVTVGQAGLKDGSKVSIINASGAAVRSANNDPADD